MELNLETLLNRLLIGDDCRTIIERIVHDKIVDQEKIISLIFNQTRVSNTETQLDLLVETLAKLCFRTQSVHWVDEYMKMMKDKPPHSTEKNFLKKSLAEIGE